jgi:hypothetical protein
MSTATIERTGIEPIGYLASGRPVWPVQGGAPVEEDAEEFDTEIGADGQVDEDGDDDNDPDAAKTPEQLREELAKTRRALANANKQAEKARLAKKAAAAKVKPNDGTDDEAAEVARETRIKRVAGVAALAGEGLTKLQAKLAVRMLDLTDVEVDEDGDGDFDDVIADLREAFPALFRSAEDEPEPRRTVRRPKVDTADKARTGAKAPTPDETIARRLMGRW